MKFLLHMDLPRVLGRRLAAAGHPCRHVGDIDLGGASDVEIMAEADRNHETILTHDLDYGHLLAFSGETAPSVIIFRLRDPLGQPTSGMPSWICPAPAWQRW